jgi:cytosine/adenosine deaminase-related metal-dependent hydrolase
VSAAGEGDSTGASLYHAVLAGGAQAMDRPIAGLAIGQRADIVCLDAEHPDLAGGLTDRWLDGYIFCAGRAAIEKVYVGGIRLVEGGRHRDHTRISERYKKTIRRLSSR